jgi:hypothetical protein
MEAIILSALGGLCLQLLNLLELNKIPKSRRPDFKDFAYYIPYIVSPLFGALIGYAYFDDQEHVNKLLAIHIGASAPLILRSMSQVLPAGIKTPKTN